MRAISDMRMSDMRVAVRQLKNSQVIRVNDTTQDLAASAISSSRGAGGERDKGREGLEKVAKSLANKRETLLHELTSFHRL